MNTRAQRLIAAGAAFAIAAGLAGCSGGTAAGPNEDRPENEVHIAVFNDAGAQAEIDLAERFNKTSDVKIVIDKSPETESVAYINRIRQSLGTENAPDVFMSWSAAQLADFVEADALLPLDDWIDETPELQKSFSPAVFDQQVIDGSAYGVPIRGTQPVFLFSNKKVLEDNGLEPAATWDELLDQTKTLTDKGIIPVGLAGASQWPTLMWFEYAYAGTVGNETVAKALDGDTDVWASDESREALSSLRELIDAGTFGSTFDSVDYDNSPALLRSGKAAYELMGTWNYAVQSGADAEFADTGLGYSPAPELDAGQPTGQLAGNVSNYYNVLADTRYPDTVKAYLEQLYSPEFVQSELALGNLPTTTDVGDYLAEAPGSDASKEFLSFTNDAVQAAPSFQLSWDQAVPTASKQAMLDAMSGFFNGSLDEDGFIDAMTSLEY
jgi:xylobiose transport system substrate-binding protein